MELIPAIDLKDGRCVRLYKGDFDAQTIYNSDPLDILEKYVGLGAQHVHVVDLNGARDGSQGNFSIVKRLIDSGAAQLQVGGGVRDLARLQQLLGLGVSRVVIGSVAVNSPELVMQWMRQCGAPNVVLGLDVRIDRDNVPWLATHGWKDQSTLSLWDAVERYLSAGLQHVLCTDIERDGALTGPNTALYTEAVKRFPTIKWQASGGIATGNDLTELNACGVAAAISGKALLENRIAPEELRPFLPNALSPALT
jgi:phosphoribosylformimino-5-aminoimidazole carboxamide ribotide isomerase